MPLAVALAQLGHHVTVIVHTTVTQERRTLGWSDAASGNVHQVTISPSSDDAEIQKWVEPGAVHILQGLPRRGVLWRVQRVLSRSDVLWGSMMEQVDDRGWRGVIKRFEYSYRLRNAHAPKFVLGIGGKAPHWFSERSAERVPVYPFAYFLPSHGEKPRSGMPVGVVRRVGFIGQLIPRKRFDLLVEALAHPSLRPGVKLIYAGSGPLQDVLHERAVVKLGSEGIEFLGVIPLPQVPIWMSSLDVLVLPSDFDGWGAVVSEALMSGVPVVCSDACGASVVVKAGGGSTGRVFNHGDPGSLVAALSEVLAQGVSSRAGLADWGRNCLSSSAGAKYLLRVLEHLQRPGNERPEAPWNEFKHRDHSPSYSAAD